MKRKHLSTLWLAGLFTTSLLAARPAQADVVPEPPVNCVDGSVGQTCHGGPFCAPAVCTSDTECSDGKVCQDLDLCTATIDCGGGGGPFPVPEITGSCAEACPAGSSCMSQKVCATPSTGTGSTTSSTGTPGAGGGGAGGSGGGSGGGGGKDQVVTGCACDLGNGNRAIGAAGALLFAAGLAGLGGRRRRRRRD